jgi:long-chain acyl-CoA synthetase
MDDAWILSDLLRELSARGDHDALVAWREDAAETLSGAELANRIGRLAAGLVRNGLEPKGPLALVGPSSPEWLIARLAIGAAGGVAVPIDDLASDDVAAATLEEIGCRRLFTTRARAEALRQRLRGRPLQIFLLDPGGDAVEGAAPWQSLLASEAAALPRIAPEDPAMIAFTSGTTAAPKSFVLTHANIAACLGPLVGARMVGPADRVLLPLPLHHVYPFVVGTLAPLCAGACVVLPQSVSARHLQQALRDARVSVIVGVPRLFAGILSGIDARARQRGRFAFAAFRALERISASLLRHVGWRAGRFLFRTLHRQIAPDLRFLVSGGARLDAALTYRLEALGWEVFSGYGLAETSSVFTGNRPGRKRIGSEGLALTGEIRIGDPAPDGVGEIQLRGGNVFTGYRNNAEATHAAFTSDGWFRTGDLGYLDRDGYLYVTGRTKEVIVLGGGKKVLPEELEKAYAASPFIREIALLEREGVLSALVVPDLEAISRAGAGQAADAVRVALADVSARLPPYQQVAGFALTTNPLPRTRLGKYRRFLLPGIYSSAQRGAPALVSEPSREDEEFLRQSTVADAWSLLQRRYPARPLTLDASPQLDLGIDSLEAMALALELEARLGVPLSEQSIAAAATVRDLLKSVLDAKSMQRRDVRVAAGPADLRWLAPPAPPVRLFGALLHALNRALMRRFFRLEATGLEFLPLRSPFLLAANHASDLDPLIIAAAVPRALLGRVYWGAAASRIFRSGVLRLACRGLRIFPVDDSRPGASLALGAEVIRRGQILVWFPEEYRSPTGALQAFRPGVGHILAATGAVAVPALIEGAFDAWPRHRRWPRRRTVRIRVGRPRSVAELAVTGAGASEIERIADGLRHAVAELGVDALPARATNSLVEADK